MASTTRSRMTPTRRPCIGTRRTSRPRGSRARRRRSTRCSPTLRPLTVPSKQQYGLGVDGTDIWNMAPYIWSMGGSFTNASYTTGHRVTWTAPRPITAVTTLVNLLKAGDIGSDFQGGASAVSGEAGFPEGRVRDVHRRPVGSPDVRRTQPRPVLRHRSVPERRWRSVSTVGGEDTVVATDGHHITDAEKFAEFLDSPFAQLAMAKQGDMSADEVGRGIVKSRPRRTTPYSPSSC